MKKDLLSIFDLSPAEIKGLLALALKLKKEARAGKMRPDLKGRTVAMIFDKPSLRTRVTFEVGIFQLAGHPIYISKEQISLGVRETVADAARNLERWVDGIVCRTFSHSRVVELAANCSIPVINALTDSSHPCQALATALTLQEHKKKLSGLKIAFVGDGNNVASSLLTIAVKLGLRATLVHPPAYGLPATVQEKIRQVAWETGASFASTTDPAAGVADADLVYTDVWASMGQEAEREKRLPEFQGYQVNAEMMKLAGPGALVSHCLPAHRGEEITGEVLDGPGSVIYDEAENRLHVQKAILVTLLGKKR